jgi:phosphinothricin acetyltransferase
VTSIRPGQAGDLEALTALYNHYVVETAITFDLAPFTVDERRPWLEHYRLAGPHRLLVALDGGELVGYASSSRFREKAAYATSIETSVYLAPERRGAGLGSMLYTALFDALAGEDIHRAYAGVTLPNEASMALHRRFGFVDIGTMHEVGRKFDRYWDVVLLERTL